MSKNYINNERFEEIILSYQSEPDIHEEELVCLFELLIDNIIGSFKFKVDVDDAKQECFTLVIRTVNNFSPGKGTAFNYFTTVIVNNLKLLYTREKKYKQKIENYIDLNKDELL